MGGSFWTEDLLGVQAEWERAVIRYNETEGTQKLSEDVLIIASMRILPEKVSLRNVDKQEVANAVATLQ